MFLNKSQVLYSIIVISKIFIILFLYDIYLSILALVYYFKIPTSI